MSDEGRRRSAERFRAARLAGTGRPEYRLQTASDNGEMQWVLNELAAAGWRLLGPAVLAEVDPPYWYGTLVREVLE